MFKNFVIVSLALAVLLPGIKKPFIGHHDWNGVYYSNIGRNYLRYGLDTGLGQVTSFGQMEPDKFSYYTHYPPLFPLLLAANFKLLGISDLSARLLPVFLSALSLAAVYRLARKLNLSRVAGGATLLIAFTPMLKYFSHMPSQESLMVLLALMAVHFYLNKTKKPFWLTVAALGFSGWAGYFLIPLLWLHAKIFRFKMKKMVVVSGLILVGTFGLHLAHTYWLTGSLTGGGLIDALLLRLNLNPLLGRPEPELAGQFTVFNYLNKQFHTLNIYYTSSLLLLSAIGASRMIFAWWKKRKLTENQGIIVALVLWGLAYPLIFSNVTFVHEYFNLFFWPGLALLAGYAVNFLAKELPGKKLAWALLLVAAMVIAKERQPFLKALRATQAHRPGYELGLQLRQTVPQGQSLRKEADEEFVDSQGIFVEFYADRQIIWDNKDND